ARPAASNDGGWAPPPASSDERLSQEAEAVLHASAERLSKRLQELGVQMRRPEVVSDRWTLMSELAASRADFRNRIGDLVYLTAAAFADVRHEDVVPGYANQVGARVALRGAAADLRRSLQGRLERAAKATDAQRPALARQAEESLAAFVSLSPSLALKTPTKREIVAARGRLREAGTQSALGPEVLPGLVEPFLALMEEAMEELTRTWLTVHDRAVWATSSARLEQVDMHLELGSSGAARVLEEAVSAAGALSGRSAPFDAFLRKGRQEASEGLNEAGARDLLARFRERLASLPFS
ncbi:hypothetical protein HPC50_40980, partial [Corallococcus exiguus]